MTRRLSVVVEGDEELRRALDALGNPRIWRRTLEEMGRLVAKNAAEKQIIRGGRFRVGGSSKLASAPAHPRRLTSRTNRLRGSLDPRESLDLRGLPRYIDVGTDVEYAPVHEFGGTVTQTVKQHTRTSAFGRQTAPYQVGPYTRTATYPRRPFLLPAARAVAPEFPSVARKWIDRELARA